MRRFKVLWIRFVKLGLLSLMINLSGFSQNNDYISYYRNVEKAFQLGVFIEKHDSTIHYLNLAFENAEPLPEDLLVLSKSYLKSNIQDDSFDALVRSIKAGIDSSEMKSLFEQLQLSQEQIRICELEFSNYSSNVDSNLYFKVDSVSRLDQSIRGELRQYSKSDSNFQKSESKLKFQDSLNRVWLLNTIITKGWPGRRLIGNDRKSFVLLLHIDKEWIYNNFELLKSQIIQGNLNPSYLAASIDRSSVHNEGIQYGSYLPGNINVDDTQIMKVFRYEIGALSKRVFLERNRINVRK